MKASEMTKLLTQEAKNHSIYLWGGQGESLADLSIIDIAKMELEKTTLSASLTISLR